MVKRQITTKFIALSGRMTRCGSKDLSKPQGGENVTRCDQVRFWEISESGQEFIYQFLVKVCCASFIG
jgi:hypothetical protein